jgi:hypothetical protein
MTSATEQNASFYLVAFSRSCRRGAHIFHNPILIPSELWLISQSSLSPHLSPLMSSIEAATNLVNGASEVAGMLAEMAKVHSARTISRAGYTFLSDGW